MLKEELEKISKELYSKYLLALNSSLEDEGVEVFKSRNAYREGVSEGFYKSYLLIESRILEIRSKELEKFLK